MENLFFDLLELVLYLMLVFVMGSLLFDLIQRKCSQVLF